MMPQISFITKEGVKMIKIDNFKYEAEGSIKEIIGDTNVAVLSLKEVLIKDFDFTKEQAIEFISDLVKKEISPLRVDKEDLEDE